MRLGKMKKKMIYFIADMFSINNKRVLKTQLTNLAQGVNYLFNMMAHYKKRITKLKQQVKELNKEVNRLINLRILE